MQPLTGLDGAFLHLETPDTPMHVGSLHLFELPTRHRGSFLADVRRVIRKRLHLAPVFQRKLAPMPLQFANPVWVHDADVDLEWHITGLTLPAPGSQAQLEDCVAQLHGELLDRSRPLWRIHVIDGLPQGRAGYYIKIHHAVLDGQSGVLLAQALFDLTPKPPAIRRAPPSGAAENPGMLALAAAALRHDAGQYIKLLRHLPEVARTLSGLFTAPTTRGGKSAGGLSQNFSVGPRTALNVPIDGARGFAALTLPIDELKQVAAAHDAKLNDVVLALCSGALRRYLARHGGIPRKPLLAAMPISLRAAGNAEYGTQATMTLVNLHSNVANPTRRLHAIRDASGAMKALARRASGILPTDFPSIAVPWLLRGLAELVGRSGVTRLVVPLANVVISNVPGPPMPLYTAGARMTDYWPLSIVEHGVGLNITVMSYAGTMGFGFTTARVAVPDARELTQALREAFEELRAKPPTRTGKTPAAAAKATKPAAKRPAAKTRSRAAASS